jgi:ribA/ribD-fused uncharacterized protein
MSESIKGFFGVYRWLSNFWYCTLRFKSGSYPTVEHAYQACKSKDPDVRKIFQRIETPREAKQLARKLILRDDWYDVMMDIMYFLVTQKFLQNPDLKSKLLATGNCYIEETNTWNDMFWGVCRGVGANNLGKIIMRVRDEIRKEIQ